MVLQGHPELEAQACSGKRRRGATCTSRSTRRTFLKNEERLLRSELFGAADTCAHRVVEPTTNDEGFDDDDPQAEDYSERAERRGCRM